MASVQHFAPDRFFTKLQQERLAELMSQWRAARDSGAPFPASLQESSNRS